MTAQVVKTGLLSELGSMMGQINRVHAQLKDKPPESRGMNLPEGIKGGVGTCVLAKLDKYKPGTTNAGKVYAIFQCIALRPQEIRGITVKGKRFNVMVDLFPKLDKKNLAGEPRTIEVQWADLLDTIKMLGFVPPAKPEQLEDTLGAITLKKPNFEYETRGYDPKPTKQNPKPDRQVVVNILGHFSGMIEENKPGAGIVDRLANQPAANGSASGGVTHTSTFAETVGADEADSYSSSGSEEVAGEDIAAEEAAQDESGDLTATSLEDLGPLADDGDNAAMDEIERRGISVGFKQEEIADFTSWTFACEMIEKKANEEPATEEPPAAPVKPAEPWEPKVKAQVKFQIKAGGKVHEAEVTKVQKKEKTVNLVLLDGSKKTYDAVPWAKLSPM